MAIKPITLSTRGTNTKSVMIQLDETLHQRLKVVAEQHNHTVTSAIREILEKGVEQVEANI